MLRLAGAATRGSVGRGRPLWTAYPSHRLSDPILAVLKAVPGAQEAALSFTGLLVLESAHLHLLAQDAVGGKVHQCLATWDGILCPLS